MGKASRRKRISRASTFWHGGVPGLRVGDELLPGGGGLLAAQTARGSSDGAHLNSGLVYFTTDRELARAYAQSLKVLGVGTGSLYRVEPLGAVVRDPDYPDPAPAISFGAPRARVTLVEQRSVTGMTETEIGRAFARYQYWAPNDPLCDADGTTRPGGYTAEGWTAEAFALLPPWTRHEKIPYALSVAILDDAVSIVNAAPRILEPGNINKIERYLHPRAMAQLHALV